MPFTAWNEQEVTHEHARFVKQGLGALKAIGAACRRRSSLLSAGSSHEEQLHGLQVGVVCLLSTVRCGWVVYHC